MLCVCVWGGGQVLETKLFRRGGSGSGSGSAAKGGLTEKVGIPYL